MYPQYVLIVESGVKHHKPPPPQYVLIWYIWILHNWVNSISISKGMSFHFLLELWESYIS